MLTKDSERQSSIDGLLTKDSKHKMKVDKMKQTQDTIIVEHEKLDKRLKVLEPTPVKTMHSTAVTRPVFRNKNNVAYRSVFSSSGFRSLKPSAYYR